MNVVIARIGKKQKSKFSEEYRCVKVMDINTKDIYTLNIASENSRKFVPFLKKGNIFFDVQSREDYPKVIDVTKGFSHVKQI